MSVYKAQLERDEDGRWSAWIDALPGCAAWGYTQDEALEALQDAAEAYIEDMTEAGELTTDRLKHFYCAVSPPSITRGVPVTNDASSDARNSAP